ncbi:MAG: cyclodeaminase/cyclohydrolase family protein [Clostridiales bacterium]|nr:cyclodeaminase/cyclohydrolase family protein [Clostridiales bacterium]
MSMKDMTVTALCELTASASPAPGGGSISAMSGAYAAALVCMVAKLTLEKEGYQDVREEMEAIHQEADSLRNDLLEDIQKDAESFDAFMVALKLPKETDEEKALRREAMQDALKGASQVPLGIARKCLKAQKLAVRALEIGNVNTASDAMVGVLLGRAATLGGVNNVLINLGGIKDEEFVARMRAACEELTDIANQQEANGQAALMSR